MKQPHDFLPETETTVPIIRGAGEGKAVGVLRDRSLFKVLPEETGGGFITPTPSLTTFKCVNSCSERATR